MIRRILCIVFAIIILTANIVAAEVITLNDFIDVSVKTNPKYQITVSEYLAALNENISANSIEDWNLIASATYSDGSAPLTTSPLSSYSNTLGYTLGVGKYFAGSGTAIQIDHGITQVNSSFPVIPGFSTPPSPYYVGNLSLTITQPLLKNAFGKITKESLKMSDLSFELASIKLNEDWEDFISTLHDDYRNWQKCNIDVQIYIDKLEGAKDQLALVKRQVKVGLSEELDAVQTEQMVKGYELMLKTTQMACDTQTNKILKLIGRDNDELSSIEPQEFVSTLSFPERNSSITYLKERSNVKKTTDALVSISKASLEIAKSSEMSDLNLVLQASPNTSQSQMGDATSLIGTEQFYMVNLSLSRPLFNDQAGAAAKQSEELYKKALKERDDIILNSEIGLSSLYTSLEYIDKMIKLSQENLLLAKERSRLEQKKFSQGRSSVFFLLQAEDALLEAEKSLNEANFNREMTINQIKSFTDKYMIEYKDVLEIKS